MSAEIFLNGRVQLCCGDGAHFLRDQPADRYDSIVTDPPYALTSTTKRWSNTPRTESTMPKVPVYARATQGFMGQKWDTGETAFAVEFWAEVLRVLKPGGHVVAFSGTRTYHRMACAIEDAGFEIRDQLQWVYGSGFPKSQNVAKFIDRELGVKGSLGGPRSAAHAVMLDAGVARRGEKHEGWHRPWMDDPEAIAAAQSTYIPGSKEAEAFNGYGTALKPACEPICLARKPLIGTVAANVLEHGTGAINIDGCRVETDEDQRRPSSGGENGLAGTSTFKIRERRAEDQVRASGRWPANIIHDGSDEVIAAFPESESTPPGNIKPSRSTENTYGEYAARSLVGHTDSGSAARFFYSAKADANDRIGSKHPTVKPVDLMQWLVRLVTPKGGLVLDPFAGTGTTAEACFREGMRCMLVERETEYQADIRRRMALVLAGPDERARESIKARMAGQPIDAGPLFAEAAE